MESAKNPGAAVSGANGSRYGGFGFSRLIGTTVCGCSPVQSIACPRLFHALDHGHGNPARPEMVQRTGVLHDIAL